MVGSPVFSLLALRTTYSSEFILTCPSSSLPPLSATWLRNGEPVSTGGDNFHTWHVLVDPSTTGYANSLRVSGTWLESTSVLWGTVRGTQMLLYWCEVSQLYSYILSHSHSGCLSKPLNVFSMSVCFSR